jgi:nitroimidazol reductase NimA-like FMN-containing flavoprotein (pyridoxamine 5'-phosphate oxidase superfamily)
MSSKYHLRRIDREIKDVKILRKILEKTTHIALAMAKLNEPYIVPLNHYYDIEENCIYFHGASVGKKIEFMKKNPNVWGLAVIDHGFSGGQCENLYASVAFSGHVTFLEDKETRISVLRKQIVKESGDKEAMMKRFDIASSSPLFSSSSVCRVDIESITGKRSTVWTEDVLLKMLDKE